MTKSSPAVHHQIILDHEKMLGGYDFRKLGELSVYQSIVPKLSLAVLFSKIHPCLHFGVLSNSKKAAIRIHKAVYQKASIAAVDWDIVRTIAYSGAKR